MIRSSSVYAAVLLLGLLVPARARATGPGSGGGELSAATPESVGMDSARLAAMAEAVIRHADAPVFSLLISRHGKLVLELYTGGIGPDHAHYLMSVTKSVVATLVGVAIDRGLLAGVEARVASVLGPSRFASPAERQRFEQLTVKDVLGMSALDAPVPPHRKTPEAVARQRGFWQSPDRIAYALSQPLLAHPGQSFQYTDLTPVLAAALVQRVSRQTLLDFARQHLFGPMGFKNDEWMHQDAAGTDNAGYGLRLRPLDMQKLGVLYLRGGLWGGRRLLGEDWVKRSFTPWIASRPGTPNYGWYFWTDRYRLPAGSGAASVVSHEARGWRGQRIAIVPSKGLVVTMTAYIQDGSEGQVFAQVMERHVLPAVRADGPLPEQPAAQRRLRAALEQLRAGPPRWPAGSEPRMIPTPAQRETRRPLRP
jgi:CubicO group peptidase (beta-lactamase class C family)